MLNRRLTEASVDVLRLVGSLNEAVAKAQKLGVMVTLTTNDNADEVINIEIGNDVG